MVPALLRNCECGHGFTTSTEIESRLPRLARRMSSCTECPRLLTAQDIARGLPLKEYFLGTLFARTQENGRQPIEEVQAVKF